METKTIKREEVSCLLENITQSGHIFSALVKRRNDVYLRYEPTDDKENGPLAYVGDHSILATREWVRAGRGGEKIVMQRAGELRWMVCRKHTGVQRPKKHWTPKGGQCAVNAKEHNLFGPVDGMYNDQSKQQPNGEKRIGRFGQWRPFQMIAIEGVVIVRAAQQEYKVVD